MKLKEQHLHKKLVHFNRTKHKIHPWLTCGILKSCSLQLACLKTNYKKLYCKFTKLSCNSIQF